jgi:hypothetical protein
MSPSTHNIQPTSNAKTLQKNKMIDHIKFIFDHCVSGCSDILIFFLFCSSCFSCQAFRGRRDRDRMVVRFITTKAISAYHHWSCEFETRSWRGALHTTGRWFSPGTPVSSTNKNDRHDITEILLEVALNTISPPNGKVFLSNV